jgi:hypothetical protein
MHGDRYKPANVYVDIKKRPAERYLQLQTHRPDVYFFVKVQVKEEGNAANWQASAR